MDNEDYLLIKLKYGTDLSYSTLDGFLDVVSNLPIDLLIQSGYLTLLHSYTTPYDVKEATVTSPEFKKDLIQRLTEYRKQNE